MGVPSKPSKSGNLSSIFKEAAGPKILFRLNGISAKVKAVFDIHPPLMLPTNSCLTRIPNPIAKRTLKSITK